MAAFRSIDRYNVGRIDTVNLATFLRAHGHNASEIELLAIIRRIDTDGDACLSFGEYAEFLKSQGGPIPTHLSYISETAAVISNVRLGSPRRIGGPNEVKPPILRVSDEDELIHSLREQCMLERELEAAKT